LFVSDVHPLYLSILFFPATRSADGPQEFFFPIFFFFWFRTCWTSLLLPNSSQSQIAAFPLFSFLVRSVFLTRPPHFAGDGCFFFLMIDFFSLLFLCMVSSPLFSLLSPNLGYFFFLLCLKTVSHRPLFFAARSFFACVPSRFVPLSPARKPL